MGASQQAILGMQLFRQHNLERCRLWAPCVLLQSQLLLHYKLS